MVRKSLVKILVVDDDISTCETLADILAMKNFAPIKAHSGTSCLEISAKQSIDVVILDIRLPDMDGLELLAHLKKTTPDIIAMFMTGHASIDYAKKAMEQGASGFFVKPVIVEEILYVINEALEKRSLARRYQETSAKLQNIIGASHDAIFSIDNHGKIEQCNQAAQYIFGYSTEDLVQMNINLLFKTKNTIEYLNFSGDDSLFDKPHEISTRNKKGDPLALEISLGPYREDNRQMFTLVVRDVSARKKYEEEKKKLQEQIIQANKMEAIGTLAGGIAHDFNNILTAILGYAQMVNDSLAANSDEYKDIEQIINAGLRAKELVSQILAFSRSSKQEAQPIQANIIIEEALNLLRASILKRIEIRRKFAKGKATIFINPAQFHQVIMNLCVNAYQAMPENGILEVQSKTISLSDNLKDKFPRLKQEQYLELMVKDNGTGMDQLVIERIFEPYFTTKKMEEGTGLGLSTVHGIIHDAGGAIEVKTKLGRGSVFTVYLPLIEERVGLDKTESGESFSTGKEHILLIDDEMPIAELGRRILEKFGYRVSSYYSSDTALDIFKKNPVDFDLIISDNSMPGITGLQLAREIYQIKPELPIILTTGFDDTIHKHVTESTSIKAILTKPISRKLLSKTIRKVLDGEIISIKE